jgi:Glycosyltransferases, probably involved in cell wall biogenesis
VEQAPACSVIVPTFRRPTQLVRCLEALSRLDYPRSRYEVIVVDDGGGIAAAALTTAFRDRLRLVLLTQPHGGPAAARNLGAAQAEGELLLFTDDDCMPDARWLQVLARRFVEAPERAAGGNTVNVLDDNVYASTSQLIIDVGYARNNGGADTARFFTTNNLRSEEPGFRLVGGFDPSFQTSEDREFCTRWIDHGLRLDFVPSAVVNHAHDLSFRTFCRQHFAYGRGALRYHTKQARRANRVRIEPAYYRELARAPFRRERPGKALVITALLGVWHVTNTAGFVFECWLRLRDRGAGVSSPGCGVLHLSWSGRIGGIERQLAAVVRAASEQDRTATHVCLLDGRGAVGDDLAAAGLATQLRLGRGWNPVGLWRLARLLRKLRPRIVHLHTHSLCAFVLSAIALPICRACTPSTHRVHFSRRAESSVSCTGSFGRRVPVLSPSPRLPISRSKAGVSTHGGSR